ncbi:MAG: hypothetical protein EOP33_06630 [Rickettsiaceae bacterium]|nr:MAG: hypothetical protein EOP33_06630 [Rickettsiaceae bacterium]
MSKKYVLKASLHEYLKYYKNLKLGLQKACLFLRDLEPKIEFLASKQPTEHRYFNPDTKKELFFEEKDIDKIRGIISRLETDYFVMKPELLKLEEPGDFERAMLYGINNINLEAPVFKNLNYLLSHLSDDEDKKLDILLRIFFRTKYLETFDTSYESFLLKFGSAIAHICVIRSTQDEMGLILRRLNFDWSDEYYTDQEFHKQLAKPVVDVLLTMDPENFFLEKNKIVASYRKCYLRDYSFYSQLPKVFSTKKDNRFFVDIEKLLFFLQDLDDYRIFFETKKLNTKVLKIDGLVTFEQMCIRFRCPHAYEKIERYSCDFLRKTVLPIEELKLNDRFSAFYWRISTMLRDIHLARLNLHTSIYNYYVMSCFSSYEYGGEELFEIAHKWIKIKRRKYTRKVKG